MSIGFALMLGCSICGVSSNISSNKSSHLNDTISIIDSTRLLTSTLTSNDTVTAVPDSLSQLFAKTLDYVSQVSKRSCTEREEIAKEIFNIALENNIDIHFILAQGTIETHLGTTGIGKSRHSIFGVYRTYPSYTDCIRDYARILKKSYLVKDRTEHDLMRRYVTIGGARYAGNPNYERELTQQYRRVKAYFSNRTTI